MVALGDLAGDVVSLAFGVLSLEVAAFLGVRGFFSTLLALESIVNHVMAIIE